MGLPQSSHFSSITSDLRSGPAGAVAVAGGISGGWSFGSFGTRAVAPHLGEAGQPTEAPPPPLRPGHGVALGVAGTAQESPSPALAHGHGLAALLALDVDLHRLYGLAFVVDRQHVAALGVAGAAQERSPPALAQGHRFAAFLADVL